MPESAAPLLFFAFYFPPENTSGVQRALRFYRYLPEHGYQPQVICTSRGGVAAELPHVEWVPNVQTVAATRGASVVARLIHRLLPNNDQLPWVPHAVAAGLRAVPGARAILSTAPPLATHLAALRLHRKTGLPWIADFRDPFFGNVGRAQGWSQRLDRRIEARIFEHASAIIGVSDTVTARWRERYPEHAHKIHLLWNGFDPAEALVAATEPPAVAPEPGRRRRILHAGVLYRERHPVQLFDALWRLVERGRIPASGLCLEFLGSIDHREELTARLSVQRLMEGGHLDLSGKQVSRAESLAAMREADALLLVDVVGANQASYTVPAKIFDYVLTGRPMFALTTAGSPVDRILAQCGIASVAGRWNASPETMEDDLMRFFETDWTSRTPSPWFFETFDGRRQAATLAALIDGLVRG